jgi:TRAP transporter TAXI family solute receptor
MTPAWPSDHVGSLHGRRGGSDRLSREFCMRNQSAGAPNIVRTHPGVPDLKRSVRTMRTSLLTCLFVFLSASLPTLADETSRISWATATKGGGFQLYGANIAEVINAVDGRLSVEVLATRGSRQNLTLLEAGEVDVGQVEGNAARMALEGIGRPIADLKILSVMYPNPGMFVVRGDSDHHSIDDLKGQPIAFGTKASGLRILANDVLDGLGLKPETDFQQIILDKAAEGPSLVMEGKAEALWGAGIGWPGFVEVANGPAGGRFIAPSAQQIGQVRARHPHLQVMTVPAGTYAGQDTDIHSVGLWSLILVRPGLDNELAYRLARAIHMGHAELTARLPQGRYTQAANTVRYAATERLHPGALQYYREIGLLPAAADVGDAPTANHRR